ncbi:MAG: acyl-CoA/acyl-ACP dehydrogenase [Candidatus Lokiarchaeota archaeon]|nr:acyl-CoA/acyl-ACP dehydrogenase [Candidatus Lokiarchaeota archaeon]
MQKTKYAQAINDEILEKLSLKNRYGFMNANLSTLMSEKQMSILNKIQEFCMNYEKENNITHSAEEDIYDYIPAFGKEGYVCRVHKFDEIDMNFQDFGLTVELLRSLALSQFDPQFLMMCNATVLAINPIKHHHDNVPARLEALKDLVTGKAPGCIMITEPERGSDATHQLTTCDPQEDGSYVLNGDKIFNTNAPKAKWAVAYASEVQNNPGKLAQFLINTEWEGWNCERVYVPWGPKIHIGKEKLVNLKVPKEYVLGGTGKGREHLFEGLVPERIMIGIENVSEAWAAISYGLIYANARKQFNTPIMNFQGVSLLLSELWARTNSLTYGLMKFCESYDEKMENYGGELPGSVSRALVGSASQFKYMAATLTKDVCYEAANIMGGAGLGDNTLMHDLLNVSRIQEIVGGSRQIQLYIMSGQLGSIVKGL